MFQSHGSWLCLVDQKSLEPTDGGYAMPWRSARDDKPYVYAVNKDTRSGVKTRLLLWAERWTLHGVRDVYSGQSLPIERDEEGYVGVPLVLEPGGGLLLAMDVADAQARR